MSQSANGSWSQSAGVQGAEGYDKGCERNVAAKERKRRNTETLFWGGGLSIICLFSLFGGHWNVNTAKSESGLYLISVEL